MHVLSSLVGCGDVRRARERVEESSEEPRRVKRWRVKESTGELRERMGSPVDFRKTLETIGDPGEHRSAQESQETLGDATRSPGVPTRAPTQESTCES